MDADPAVLPNELALSLGSKCRKWTYIAYTGEPEANGNQRNPTVDSRYDTRLDRTTTDLQGKIQSQKRVLEDVHPNNCQVENSYLRSRMMKRRNNKQQYKI